MGGSLPALFEALVAAPGDAALCLDFDGTLSAIVDDPVAARPLPGVSELLSRLAASFGVVAVISGRPVAFLDSVLGSALGVRLVGLYGLEHIDDTGRRCVGEEAAAYGTVIDEVVAEARADVPHGVYVEPKGLTVTLHWRHAPEAAPWVRSFATRQARQRGLVVHPGRMELELRPPLAVDKGTVVRAVVHGCTAVAAFGDDIGDLPAFAVLGELKAQGIAVVRVAVTDEESPPEVAAQADMSVEGPSEAVALLELLAQRAEAAAS